MSGRKEKKEPNLEAFIDQKTTVLREELRLISSLIKDHEPSVGTFYETVLKKFLQEFLPKKVKVGAGFLFDIGNNSMSRQMDIIVYEDYHVPPIYQHQDFVVVDYNTVKAVIEVKATIDSKRMGEASENLASAMAMLPAGKNWFLVGIRSKLGQKTISKRLKDSLDDCSGVLVLNDPKEGGAGPYYVVGEEAHQEHAVREFLKDIWNCVRLRNSRAEYW